MKYNFDEIIDRAGTHSEKWSRSIIEKKFGNPDAIPMWVADMDFQAAPPIVAAVTARAAHGIYGYSGRDDGYYESIIRWQSRRHHWEIQKDWILYTPGVVPAIAYCLMAYTRPGDKILIMEPVYYPFRRTVEEQDRTAVVSPLILQGGRYRMDFEDLDARAADPEVKMLILCSPHNPVGRVWTREELTRLGEICQKHGLLILADEIHNDLVMPGHSHTVLASLSPALADRTITCIAPSKTFNLAGMQSSSVIIPNPALRELLDSVLTRVAVGDQSPFGIVATIAAYGQGEDWLDEAIRYIAGNFEVLTQGLGERLPKARVAPMEGTYLAWVDLSAYLAGGEPPEMEVGRRAGVGFVGGPWFGAGGEGHLRVNLACPRSLVTRAVARLGDAFGGG